MKYILGLIVSVGFLLLAPSFVYAADYYVSTSGSDSNNGSISSPWKTIQKAATTMVAGDTAHIRGGTYPEQVIPQNSGTASAYITYIAYPGEVVTIDGSALVLPSSSGLIWIKGKSYITVSGLRAIHAKGGFATMGIQVYGGSSYINVLNNYTQDTASCGIGVYGSNNVVVNGNEIVGANTTGSEENLSVDTSYNVEIEYNNVHNGGASTAGGEGINIKNGSHDVKVHNNVVHDNPKLAFGVDAWTAHTYNISFYSNVAYNDSHGFILESEQGGLGENLSVYNNIAYNIANAAYELPPWGIAGPIANISFINNTAYNSTYGFWTRHTNITNVVFRNNIVSQNQTQISLASTANITIDHNLFYGNASTNPGTNYVVGDPKFVNPPTNFHIQAGSPAIDAGSSLNAPSVDFDGNPRPQGAGYDIGAYEFLSGGATPTPTLTPMPTTIPPTSTPIPTPTSVPSPTPTPTCSPKPGDANGDCKVNETDYSIWLAHFLQHIAGGASVGDFNGDGVVDGIDFTIWTMHYGT